MFGDFEAYVKDDEGKNIIHEPYILCVSDEKGMKNYRSI